MATENVIFSRELFREDYQKVIYGVFRELLDVFGKRVSVARKYADHREYRVWRGELHDPEMEKRVQFSFGVSDSLHMGGLLRSVPFVEPDVAMRGPFEVVGPASPASGLVKARPAAPEVIGPEAAPYSFGIFDVRRPETLLTLMKVEMERFQNEGPKDVLFNDSPVLVIVEQNWFTKFIPRLVGPKSELFRLFSLFADHTRELASSASIIPVSAI